MEGYDRYRFQDFPWLDKEYSQCMEFLKDETKRELGLYLPERVNAKQLTDLLDLAKKNGFLNAIMLDKCKLGDEVCEIFADYLKDDDKLRYLFLENNNITDKGVDVLVEALKDNKSLKSIWLGRNQITNDGVAKFSEFIIASEFIKEFSVGGEHLDDDGAYCIARALHRNPRLVSVHLLDNKLQYDGARLLAEVSSTHENCKTLEVHSKEVSAESFSNILKNLAETERKKAFEDAVKNGEEGPWLRCKIMVVGQGRAGKTATVRSMLNLDFQPNLPSTVGADIKTSTTKKDANWADTGASAAKVDLAVDAASRLAMLKLRKQKNQQNQAFNLNTMEEMREYLAKIKAEEQTKLEQQRLAGENIIPTDLQEEINKSYNAALVTNKDASLEDIEFTIWDYGGQKVFYTLHHLFLTQYGIYILAFDMRDVVCPELKMNEEGFREKKKKQKECREYLEFWLNSVGMHAAEAPMIIVGTYLDVVGNGSQVLEVNDFIKDVLGDRFPQVVKNNALSFFPLSNKNSKADITALASETGGKGGSNIDTIRDTIDAVARKQAFVNQNLSLRWIKCLDKMLQEPADFISLDHTRKIAETCGIKDATEVENLLRFFHELGMIVHLDSTEHLRAIVTIKPQWLINELSKIIRDKKLHTPDMNKLKTAGLTKEYERIRDESIATKDWLEYCWTTQRTPFLIDLMKRTMLLSEWKFGEFKKEPAFLVPSLIEDVDEKALDQVADMLVQFKEKEEDIEKEIENMKKEGYFGADEDSAKNFNIRKMFFGRGKKAPVVKGEKKPADKKKVKVEEIAVEKVEEDEEEPKKEEEEEEEEEKIPEGFFSTSEQANGIVFDFRKSFLPNGVFQRLLCLCILKVDSGKEFDHSPDLSRTSAEIKMGGGQIFRLYNLNKQILCTVTKDHLASYKVLLSMMQKLKADVMGKGLDWDVYLETIDPSNKDEEERVFHKFVKADEVMKAELAPWFHEGKHKKDEELILKQVGVELEDFLKDLESF